MWKMKCNENGQLLNTTKNSVCDPSLRPPIPRAITSWSTKNSSIFSTTTSSCYYLQNPNIPAWNIQPLNGLMSDYGVKKEINRMPLVSTRWNPTPDQLQALEEMYRRGIRTPSAQQIQQITAKLRKFGKIEGKNVFYWFQNHKAREKQKKRRQLELLAAKNMSPETRQSGLSKRYLEIQEPNRLPTSSNCNTPSKYSINDSVLIEECKKDMWTQLDQKELQQQQQQKKIITANSQICLFSCMSPNSSLDKGTSQKALGQENGDVGNGIIRENKTLQLFPIKDNNLSNLEETKEFSCMGTRFKPNQFIEFLPMKSG